MEERGSKMLSKYITPIFIYGLISYEAGKYIGANVEIKNGIILEFIIGIVLGIGSKIAEYCYKAVVKSYEIL